MRRGYVLIVGDLLRGGGKIRRIMRLLFIRNLWKMLRNWIVCCRVGGEKGLFKCNRECRIWFSLLKGLGNKILVRCLISRSLWRLWMISLKTWRFRCLNQKWRRWWNRKLLKMRCGLWRAMCCIIMEHTLVKTTQLILQHNFLSYLRCWRERQFRRRTQRWCCRWLVVLCRTRRGRESWLWGHRGRRSSKRGGMIRRSDDDMIEIWWQYDLNPMSG